MPNINEDKIMPNKPLESFQARLKKFIKEIIQNQKFINAYPEHRFKITINAENREFAEYIENPNNKILHIIKEIFREEPQLLQLYHQKR